MRTRLASLAFIFLLIGCAATNAAVSEKQAARRPFHDVAAAVVQVRQVDTGIGTGFVVDVRGLVLTNNHIVERVADVDGKLSSGKYEVCTVASGIQSCVPAEVVATDAEHDLALLKVDKRFPAAVEFGDDLALASGDLVYYWGNVGLILPPTLFVGRFANRAEPPYTPIKFPVLVLDVSMNYGGSGSPVFNERGKVVGIMVGFTKIANQPDSANAGAPLAVAIPAAAIVEFIKKNDPFSKPKPKK